MWFFLTTHKCNLPRKKYRWICKNNRPPGYFIDIGKIYNVSMLKYTNNLYTNYLLYGDVKTVGLGLTFQRGWEVACPNICIRRLLFTIITFLKVSSKRIRDFKRDWWEDNRISAWSRWKYLGIPARLFTRIFRYIVIPVIWILTTPNWLLIGLHNALI